MIVLTSEELRKIQMIQLEMLIEVDRICQRCHIKYNIIAGTLLGSVRHGGYIPWDDDADMAMFRSEYERFREACRKELDRTRFYFQDHRNTEGYRWGYGKLRRKNTVFLREHQEHMPYAQGIFIDIFPLDYVPENYGLRCLHNFHCFCLRKILWSPVGCLADKKRWKRIWYSCLKRIPVKLIFRDYHRLIYRSNRKRTSLVRILMFPTPNSTFGYYEKWYRRSDKKVFEGRFFSGIKDYEEYLTFKFGDYMTLPPANQRKTHPVSKLRLTEPELGA